MTKERALIFIALLTMIILGGLYYVLSSIKKPASQPSASMEKIRIGNIGEYSVLNLIAKENGYFTENGLDAEIIEYPSGPAAMNDLLTGKVDIAIAADFVGARTILDHKDLRVLASVDKHEDFRMIVRKDRVASPADLKGKKIAVTLGGAGEFFLRRFLSFNNIGANEVVVVDITPDEIARKLENREVDACVVFSKHIYNIKNKMGDAVDVWTIQRTRKIFATVYSMIGFVSQGPGISQKYLRSLLEAETYLHEHPEESKAILKKAMGYDDGYVMYVWPNFEFAVRLDQEFLLALEDDARFIINNKLTKETMVPNYLKHIDFEALSKEKPEAISIIH